MNAITHVSRRGFLKTGAYTSGALVLGVPLVAKRNAMAQLTGEEQHNLNLFLSVRSDGSVLLVAMSPDIGQGARTSMPTIVADELEADWDRIEIVQAGPDARLGDQGVGGSSAIRDNWDGLRRAGATARTMLERAAAEAWEVPVAEVKARNHAVHHEASGRSLGYGELAERASKLPVPDESEVRLKEPGEYRYIGKDQTPVDQADIVRGQAIYSIDVSVPNMKHAVMQRSPCVGGKLTKYNADAALAIPGVEQVIEVEGGTLPPAFNPIGGLAVIADSTWAAKRGVDALEIEWNGGPNATYNSPDFRAAMEEAVSKPGALLRDRGDVDAAFAEAAQVIEADYYIPHHSHAQMEPPVAVADVREGQATIWMPTQDPQGAQQTIAGALGLAPEDVTLHVTLTGGGFGRKGKPDYGVEAAVISQKIGAPVKLTWTREDDIRHGYYHTCCAQKMKGGIDANGKVTAYLHRSSFPSISSTFQAEVTQPAPFEMGQGITNIPYDIPNIRGEYGFAKGHVRIGWSRSVSNINHAFAAGSFVDELAHAAGRDTAELLLELVGRPRHVDIWADGVRRYGYEPYMRDHPIDTGRLAAVIRAAMDKAEYGRDLPAGRAMGIAAHRSFLTYVCCIIEVDVADDMSFKIPRLTYAVDLGQAVNPDRVRAQMEGGALYGLSLALFGEITATDGAIDQSNYHDYEVARMDMAPGQIDVVIMDRHDRPTGIGEPPTPPVAPALANALFRATGKRIRSLPIRDQLRST